MSAYLDTRVSLFSSRLWQDQALDALVDVPDEVLTGTLVRQGLSQLAAGYGRAADRHGIHSLEQRIITQILDETRILIRPLSGPERAFLTFWTARFELSNLKALLRSKISDESAVSVLARLTPMGAFGRLDLEDLARAEDVGELLRRLESGPYAGIVRHARRAFEQSHDPFNLDAALDQGYYEGLMLRARPLEKAAGRPFRNLMASLIDRINLVWLLRYRFNYKLPPAQVYFLLVGSRYDLSGTLLQELAAQDSVQAVLATLPPAWRQRLAGVTGVPGVFARMERVAAEQAQRILGSGAPGIARAFAYLILRERDLRAVRAVLRGRHLGLGHPAIRLALRREPAEAA